MAALPYMQFYVPDYLADTIHLTTEEHGAYLLLIFNYWQTGKAIPKSRLARVAGLTQERWEEVAKIIGDFFEDDGEKWFHARIEADLQSVRESQEQKIKAGQASAASRQKAARERMKEQKRNGRSTFVEQTSNDRATNQNHQSESESSTDKPQAPAKPKPQKKNAIPFPEQFPITPEMQAWAQENAPNVNLHTETCQLQDWALGKGEKKIDWIATWRNWMRRAQDRTQTTGVRYFPNNPMQQPEHQGPRNKPFPRLPGRHAS